MINPSARGTQIRSDVGVSCSIGARARARLERLVQGMAMQREVIGDLRA